MKSNSEYVKVYCEEILPILKSKESLRKRIRLIGFLIRLLAITQVILPYFWPFFMGYVLIFLFGEQATSDLDFSNYKIAAVGYMIAFLYSIIVPCYLVLECIPIINKKFQKELKELVVPKILKFFDNIRLSYNSKNITPEKLLSLGFEKEEICGLVLDVEYSGVYNNVEFGLTEGSYVTEDFSVKTENVNRRILFLSFKSRKVVKDTVMIIEKSSWKDNLLWIILGAIIVIGVTNRIIFDCVQASSWKPILGWIIIFCVVYYCYRDKLFNKNNDDNSKIVPIDVASNKKFRIKAVNPLDEHNFIIPEIFTRLNNLKSAFKAKLINCFWKGDHVVFAIYTPKKVFEFENINKPLVNIDELNNFIVKLEAVHKMIDCLEEAFDEN